MTDLSMEDFDNIKKIIEEYDQSCTCCGPTDIDLLTKKIVEYLKERIEK